MVWVKELPGDRGKVRLPQPLHSTILPVTFPDMTKKCRVPLISVMTYRKDPSHNLFPLVISPSVSLCSFPLIFLSFPLTDQTHHYKKKREVFLSSLKEQTPIPRRPRLPIPQTPEFFNPETRIPMINIPESFDL